jgi:ABC-type branched-subunit amino acid transport system substrate-binding protein
MKRLKWIGAIAMALALVAAACGGDDEATDTTAAPDGGDTSGEELFIDPEFDCAEDYNGTQGIEGDTIKIGTIRPSEGPFVIFDQVTAGLEAYVNAANEAGGITAGDGKAYQIELIKENDGYDPARTPALARKLVEEDGVFALVGVIGTENNKAIRDYLNENCVPNIALGTGSTEWGRADEFPWYISSLPSYALEANAWADYLAENNPDAKVAILFQDDDFGKAYQKAFKKAVEGTDIEVVAEQGFNPLAGGTTEAAVVQLSQSGADTFIAGISGTPCPQTLGFIPQTWEPEVFISLTCAGGTAMAIAGDAAEGVITAQAIYDPSDPADAALPQVQEFVEQATIGGLDESQINGGISAAGWGFGAFFAKGLEETETVDRASVMNALFALEDAAPLGLVREGITINTNGGEDPWAIEGYRLVQRNADGSWQELKGITNREGESNDLAG